MINKAEEDFRKLAVEVRVLEQSAETLASRMNMVNAVTADLSYAKIALEGLEKEQENTELLVPIGGSSYVRAKLQAPDKVVVGIGAGVSTEKTLQEAKEIVSKRLEELEKTRTSIQQQYSQIAERINEDREVLEELAAKLRKEKTLPNV